MSKVFRANFEIGANKKVSGVMDDDSKKFSCWSSEFFHVEDYSNIYGKNHKNQCISLLNCIGNTATHSNSKNESTHTCDVYSHTMILGIKKVIPEEDKFISISLTVGNPLRLFRNLKSFGYIQFPDNNLIDALNEQKYTPQFDEKNHPIIGYFNGEFEIFKQETKLGLIKAHNSIRAGSPSGATGVEIANEVIVTIDFHDEVYIEEAFKRANLVSLFLRFIGGKGLFFKDISLKMLEHEREAFKVHHDTNNWGNSDDEDYHSDPLIDVTSTNFPEILKRWFDKEDRENVRYSFYNTYFQETYSSDRLITAANMFDIFPCADGSAKKEISSDAEALLQSLKMHVKSEFSGFSNIKNSLLQSIGHITRKALKDRVMERLEILRPELVGHKLSIEDLEFVVGIAIKSRNYYVHGSEYKKLSPEQLFSFQILFIDTFEYIYAMSELLECGWSSKNDPVLTSHHRIRGCGRDIDFVIRDLKKAMEK